MSYNREKLRAIIGNECRSIEERCPGYIDKLEKMVDRIIELEEAHDIQPTTIQKQITRVCYELGEFLRDNRESK